MPVNVEEVLRLPIGERLDLVMQIWDSIGAEDGHTTLTPSEVSDLRSRIKAHAENPSAAIPWDQLKLELLSNSRRRDCRLSSSLKQF